MEMKRQIAVCMMSILLFATTVTFADTLFEDIHIVKKPWKDRGYRGMNGDLLQLKDGSILYCYTEEGPKGVQNLDPGGIMAMKSKDKGKTWTKPFVLIDQPQPPAKGYYGSPSLLRVKNDEILLTYIYRQHPLPTPYYASVFYRRSADEGKTWTDQFLVTPYPGYTLIHNDKVFTLKDGRIIAMAEYKDYMPGTNDHGGYVGLCFYSDDNGHTWYPSKNKVDMYKTQKVDVQEPDAVELKDGRLLMFARTYSGYPVRAYSKDRGETWSEGEPIKELKMPYAGLPTVRRIPKTNDLVFIWIGERARHRRCALRTAISKDEGRTFMHQRNIVRDPKNDVGYQCIEFIGDDIALVGYEANDGLHMVRIGVDWFYEATEVGDNKDVDNQETKPSNDQAADSLQFKKSRSKSDP